MCASTHRSQKRSLEPLKLESMGAWEPPDKCISLNRVPQTTRFLRLEFYLEYSVPVVEKMAQGLRVFAAFSNNQSSVPAQYESSQSSLTKSRSRGSHTLFWLHGTACMWYKYMQAKHLYELNEHK
jgi:hypothetical protein